MKRNCGLDFLKFICCFMVICLHISLPKSISCIITPLSRIAVPIFFMITGYFYSYANHKKQILKIAKVFFAANALFLFYSCGIKLINEQSFTTLFNAKTIFEFVVLNESPFGYHLWYLGAILYVLIIIYCFEKRFSREILYFLIPILLLSDLVLGKYSLLLMNKEIPYIFVRNFLFVGLPYFLIGDILFKKNINGKQKHLWMLIFLFMCTTLVERNLLQMFNLNATRDHYLSTTFLAVSCFLLACNYGDRVNNKIYKKLCLIGSKLSLDIYIIHPIVILAISVIVRIINNGNIIKIYSYASPIVVFVVSIVISKLKLSVTEKLKSYKKDRIGNVKDSV